MATLAVQLLTYERTDPVALRALLASLVDQTDAAWTLHWWDNGSPDGVFAKLDAAFDEAAPAFAIVRHRSPANIGFAGGHQALYATHDADYVALLNDDAIIAPAYFAELRKALDARPDLGAVSGVILRWEYGQDGGIVKTDSIDSLGLARERSHQVHDIGAGERFDAESVPEGGFAEAFGVSGCLPMYRRRAVGETLFDPAYFFYKEDVDLAYRLVGSGWKAGTAFGALAYHHRALRPSFLHRGASKRQQFFSYRNHLLNLKRHLTQQDWLRDGVFVVAFEAAKAAFLCMTAPGIVWRAWREAAAFPIRRQPAQPMPEPPSAVEDPAEPLLPAHPATTHDVAIVTVCTNRLDKDCLRSVERLRKATPLSTCFIVVDNGSTAFDAHAYVKSVAPDAVVLLRDGNYGFGSSCNLGAAEVRARHYFFLNPDTRIDDDAVLTRLHRFMTDDPSVGIVAPRLRYMDGKVQETCRRFPEWYTPIHQRLPFLSVGEATRHKAWFLMQDFDHDAIMPVDWAQGSALMVDGDLFRELGGFDERFWMYYEDVDLCRRSWERGRPVYYFPRAELFHAYGKESAKMKNIVQGLVANPKTRTHIASWVKYTMKWGGRRT